MENINYAFAEVLDVLDNMNVEYINMIPKKLIKLFRDNADKNYKKHINSYLDFENANLSKKTIDILALINLRYWSKDEKHRRELLKNYKNNVVTAEKDNIQIEDVEIVNKQEENNETNQSKQLDIIQVKKEPIVIRILNKLLGIKKEDKNQ